MKKLLAILLCIATLFSFAACSNDDDDDDRKSTKKKPTKQEIEIVPHAPNENIEAEARPAEPTEEELNDIRQYFYLCAQFRYLEGVSQEQLQNLYQQLLDAENLDRWLNTEYAANLFAEEFGNDDFITDRQTLLNNFVILDDVLLHYRRAVWSDNLGNVNTNEQGETYWEYNENGEVCRTQNPKYYVSDFSYYPYDYPFTTEYDESGKPLCKRYYINNDTVYIMVLYNYDETGRLISEEYRQNTNSKFVYFTYDENGRLAQAKWENILTCTLDYAYDEEGRLIRETYTTWISSFLTGEPVRSTQKIREYTYDENGVRIGGTFSEGEYYSFGELCSYLISGTLSFTYDENGRILSEVREYGPRVNFAGQKDEEATPHTVSSETLAYTYGAYYIYAG